MVRNSGKSIVPLPVDRTYCFYLPQDLINMSTRASAWGNRLQFFIAINFANPCKLMLRSSREVLLLEACQLINKTLLPDWHKPVHPWFSNNTCSIQQIRTDFLTALAILMCNMYSGGLRALHGHADRGWDQPSEYFWLTGRSLPMLICSPEKDTKHQLDLELACSILCPTSCRVQLQEVSSNPKNPH